MSLEDQIRRMGDARAAEVTTPSWRDRVGGGRGIGPRLVAAAAVIAVIVAIGAIAVLSDDDPDTDVAGPRAGLRWIPGGGVERIDYPGEAAFFAQFIGWPEVALVTPGGRVDVSAEETTRLLGGSSPYRTNSALADDFSVSTRRNGVVSLSLDRGEDVTVASIETRRFTAEELEERAPELLEISTDLRSLADAVASWDDVLAVAYVGEPVPIEATISADDSRDEGVFWLDTSSSAQFVATNGPGAGSDWFEGLFALESSDDYTLTEDYFGAFGDAPAVRVTDSEWLLIVNDVLGADPQVEFPGSELLSTDPGAPRVATPAAETVRAGDGDWTVALHFAEPTTFRDGGAITATIGGVTLTFGLAEPGAEFTSLVVPSRMLEAEAHRYAELINEFFTNPAPPTTTTDGYPTIVPAQQTGICAANPVPSDEVLDLAAHIAFDRTPLDLDQDGVDDEMLIYDDADGNWFLLARLQAGWTNALEVGDAVLPSLVRTPGGVPAAADLDGDGGLEFFLARDATTTGRDAGVVSLRGCDLVDEFALADAPDDPGHRIGVPTAPPVDPECESGCLVRVTCRDNVLVEELVINPASPIDANWTWTTTEVRFVDGAVEINELPERTGSPLTTPLPDDAPGPEDAGVIDCTP